MQTRAKRKAAVVKADDERADKEQEKKTEFDELPSGRRKRRRSSTKRRDEDATSEEVKSIPPDSEPKKAGVRQKKSKAGNKVKEGKEEKGKRATDARQKAKTSKASPPQEEGKETKDSRKQTSKTETTEQEEKKKDVGVPSSNVPQRRCCPLTLKPFMNPVLFGDGHTYEAAAIQKWMEARKTFKIGDVGPLGAPVLTLAYGSNFCFQRGYTTCDLSQEAFVQPVAIVPIYQKWTEIKSGFHSYECSELIRGLNSTWVHYDQQALKKFVPAPISDEEALTIRDLNSRYTLVPNRILWPPALDACRLSSISSSSSSSKEAPLITIPIALPRLPTRGAPPQFKVSALRDRYTNIFHHAENGSENLEAFASRPETYSAEGSYHCWRNLRADGWVLSIHGKMYKFINCLFEKCIFRNVCWCNISFRACRFVDCTWIECEAKTHSSMFNCEFKSCVVVARQDQKSSELKHSLIGLQSDPTAAYAADAGILALDVGGATDS